MFCVTKRPLRFLICGLRADAEGLAVSGAFCVWKWEGAEAGRVDRGWADDSILRRSVAPHLTASIRWWSSPRCRVILLPPFRTSTARHMFCTCRNNCTWIVLAFLLLFLRLIIQRTECSLFTYCECWGRIEVLFVFLEQRAGVDWCCVAGKHQKWVSLNRGCRSRFVLGPDFRVSYDNTSAQSRSCTSTSCYAEQVRFRSFSAVCHWSTSLAFCFL